MNSRGLTVARVAGYSEEIGSVRDRLTAINGMPVRDLIDYCFLEADEIAFRF